MQDGKFTSNNPMFLTPSVIESMPSPLAVNELGE